MATKIQIKYKNETERIKILEILSKNVKVIRPVGKAYKSGKYYRIYIDVEV